MTQPNKFLHKLFQAVAVIAIAALFVGLGFWQLQRAADLKASLKIARTVITDVVPLQTVATPRQSLGEQAFNQTVSVTGKYIANFRAPNQKDGNGVVSDWEVALAQVDKRSAILVVRGLWSDRLLNPEIQQSMNIDVEGKKFNSEIEKLDKGATYAVYCRSGRRSAIAVQTMKDAGFNSLFNMKSGTEEWSAAGLPLVAE